jgi:hypothetical protein
MIEVLFHLNDGEMIIWVWGLEKGSVHHRRLQEVLISEYRCDSVDLDLPIKSLYSLGTRLNYYLSQCELKGQEWRISLSGLTPNTLRMESRLSRSSSNLEETTPISRFQRDDII